MYECKRLDTRANSITLAHCNRFSELASQNCPQRKALLFASKRYCRYDATKERDGPAGFRKLPVTNNVPKYQHENGWLLKEPTIGFLKKSASRPNPETAWLKSYVEGQTRDINQRTQELERRINSTSKFYKDLNNKYSFRQMSREQLLIRVRQLNENSLRDAQDEDVLYEGKTIKKAEDLYHNLNKTRRKFKLIENYQNTVKTLAKKTHELDYMNHHNKYMLQVLKNDRNVIEQFNNANYKFPLHSTAAANVVLEKIPRKQPKDPRLRLSFRVAS